MPSHSDVFPLQKQQLSAILSDFWETLLPSVKEVAAIPAVIARIQHWAGEQPAVTNILCQYVLQYSSQIDEKNASSLVDSIVHQQIIQNWESSQAADHLHSLSNTILSAARKDLLLLLYLKILQRGQVPADSRVPNGPANSPEQEILIRSGLVTRRNRMLKITCPLYAQVFNRDWIEQQLPGITRPVTIVSSTAQNRRPSPASGLYSKLAVIVCCLAVAGAVITAYRREPINQASATQSETITPSSAPEEIPPEEIPLADAEASTLAPSTASAPVSSLPGDRILFDQGVDHATNSRWLPMAREFCQIPETSTYFMPAKRQLEQWTKLYREDIQIAQETFAQEGNNACNIIMDVLDQPVQ